MTKEYKCNNCKRKTEQFAQIASSLPEMIKCSCGGYMIPVISKPIKPILKGKGFYETDYKVKK